MIKLNENFFKFPGGYLFAEMGKRSAAYQAEHPDKEIISLGIGDVTLPLAKPVTDAMQKAVAEMAAKETFHGYGNVRGYEWLRKAVLDGDYVPYGVHFDLDEIFMNDGSKTDCGNIIELFGNELTIAVCEPTYPVYVDANVMAGKAGDYHAETGQWDHVLYLPCRAESDFAPVVPGENDPVPDLIYLCYPNNPTGAMISKELLQQWVDYARAHGSVILYDGAYVGFIDTPGAPHTIYECEGAKECAIELRSFSKTAGFTGVRLGYTIVPKELVIGGKSLNAMWFRRQRTKCNGISYITQRGGEAVYTPEGRKETAAQIAYYRNNCAVIRREMEALGYTVYGGKDAPYVWVKLPAGETSWQYFDRLLADANVIGAPGSGFGPSGEGYFRFTGFNTLEKTEEALERIRKKM